VARRDPGAIHSLLGRTYTVTGYGHKKERRDLADDEWAPVLREVFGLELTADEQQRLLPTADGV